MWSRHHLLSKHERLLRLEQHTQQQRVKLSDQQIRLLERFSPEFRDRHIQTHYTGELLGVDTFYVGTLKGVGRVYMQAAIDCHSRYAWARLYTNKLPVTAVQLLNNHVLPTFDKHRASIQAILSDNGREFCGRPDRHPYELFLQLEQIEHRTTKINSPQTNGFVERLHRTILDEHFRIVGRKTWYESVDQMQKDLDAYLIKYNQKRPHQGRNMNGMTPLQAFKKGLTTRPQNKEEAVEKSTT